jgi:ABC-type molybdate transport system ATPase subunit
VPEITRLATTMVLLADGRVATTGTVSEIMGRLEQNQGWCIPKS